MLIHNCQLNNSEEIPNFQLCNSEIMCDDQRPKRKYDLEERTLKYGREIVLFAKTIKETTVNRILISQMVRAGTSIGANYCEADDACSKKDFVHKLYLCRKESRETKHWLKMVELIMPEATKTTGWLWQEAQELNLIFSSIILKLKKSYANK